MAKHDEERSLTPVEIALNRVRLAAFVALEQGATRAEIEAEVAEASRILNRQGRHA
jgi:hypothetical protein